MKKKVLLFIVLVLSLTFILPLTIAENNTQIDDAYACLQDEITEKTCDDLSTTEKIFSVLALGECRNELIEDAKNNECWPKNGCNIKTTSQAILALGKATTYKAQEWLLEQNGTPSEINWYLQIDASEPATCTITYDNDDYSIDIEDDKTIDSDAGSCLSLVSSGYWLEISRNCYDEKFEISCDEDFVTNLLFNKDDSLTIHVSEHTSSESSGGTTSEKVNSFCFVEDGDCDYGGSLWATLALDFLGEKTSSYMPYLITMEEENEDFLPEAFLYDLTGYPEFQYDLISKQSTTGYWKVSLDKYYDTALALYPFSEESFDSKEKAKEWLLKDQDDDGCWNSKSILDTAFILYSVWPKSGLNIGELDCEGLGYCMSASMCSGIGGEPLNYNCDSWDICCDTEKTREVCEDLGGEVCGSGEKCSESTIPAKDTDYCCLDECLVSTDASDCASLGGFCEGECGEGYERNYEYDCELGNVCCMKIKKKGVGSLFWIFLVLIILIILAIIFRNKLKEFWFKIKSKFKKSKPPRPGLRKRFPSRPSTSPRRIVSRHVMPVQHRPVPPKPIRKPEGHYGELEHVLKKLKDMSNK